MSKMTMLVLAVMLSLFSVTCFAAVNINTANADTIQQELSGIGAQKAAAIVAYRDLHGNFKTADELTNVKGIGIKTIEKNRDNIVVEPPDSAR